MHVGRLSLPYMVLLLGVEVSSSPPESLRFVSLLYRHGDRSPTKVYPKDKNQLASTWPDGLEWLTKTGKRQQYELGQYIRGRYTGFLNTSYYNHNEILIQASAAERCLMSAYCNLAGLFPPGESQVWNDDIPWQPIPVQTIPREMDNKLALKCPCPRYDQLLDEVFASPAIKREEEENKEFYDFIEENTGIKKESLHDIWEVADTLICERAHNLTWNDWVYEDGVWDKINTLRTYGFDILYNNLEMAKLKGGPLLKEIITNMKTVSENPSKPFPKVYMYSAHDITVAPLLVAMRVFDLHQPMYRALVMVELHEINGEYSVQIYYKNETTSEPYLLTPIGCGSPCTLDSFVEVTKTTVPTDWNKECEAHVSSAINTGLSAASWIVLLIGISMFLLLAVSLSVLVMRLRKKRDIVYAKL